MNPQNSGIWSVRDHGAQGDMRTNDSGAIQDAIDACHEAGGGRVVFPAGDYLSGTLYLRDRVTVELGPGAVLWGSTERADYEKPHLIYAKGVTDISITGPGAIDGQGEAFWVRQEGERWRPGEFRPLQLLYFEECRDVLIRDVRITNSPGWTVHLARCDNVVVRGVTILNDIHGPNTDGIDPDSCTNVHISDCHIVAGDDCIVLKAMKAYPCENVTVTNCTLETTCTALKLGTENFGDIRHCTFSNCTVRNTNRGIALYAKDGGTMENVVFSNITMETAADAVDGRREWPIHIDVERREPESRASTIRDVTLSNVVIETAGRCLVQGMRSNPIERLTLDGVTVKVTEFQDPGGVGKPRGGRTVWDDPEAGGQVEAPGQLVFANVRGLMLRNVRVAVETENEPKGWSALIADGVEGVTLDGFAVESAGAGYSPSVLLRDCQDVLVRGSVVSPGTGTFLQLEGEKTERVSVIGNDLAMAAEPVSLADNVRQDVLYDAANRQPPSD